MKQYYTYIHIKIREKLAGEKEKEAMIMFITNNGRILDEQV